jgi:hypothetical protein
MSRIIEALLKASQLFFLGNIKEELQDRGTVFDGKQLFPIVDEVVTCLLGFHGDESVDPHHQYILIV